MKKSLQNFLGCDADLETSLFEYGVISQKYTKDGRDDEYFCIYKQCDGFGSGYITEENLDKLIMGEDWMSENDIVSFLETFDCSLNDWLKLSFENKLSDLFGYYGSENIFGTDYHPLSEEQIRNLYDF